MKNIRVLAGVLTVLFLNISCQKNIKVSPPPYAEKVSIQCFIEPDSLPVLYLDRTVGYFDKAVKRNALFITGSTVVISGGNVADTLIVDSTFDKIDCQYSYFYKGHRKILASVNYHLAVSVGNESYSAEATTDIIPPILDSASYVAKFNDVNGEHEGVIVYFTDNASQANYYRYELLRYIDTATKKAEQPILSACLGKDSIQTSELGRAVFTDIGLQGQQLKIVVEPSYSHKEGTSGLMFIQAIDKNAYDFLNQLDQQKIAANNPFVEPVFIRPGQFGDKAIGFFSAKQNSTAYHFVYPE